MTFDGYQIRLRAPRENGDHVVFLEDEMIGYLLSFFASFEPRFP
jgi:hypothetical protein